MTGHFPSGCLHLFMQVGLCVLSLMIYSSVSRRCSGLLLHDVDSARETSSMDICLHTFLFPMIFGGDAILVQLVNAFFLVALSFNLASVQQAPGRWSVESLRFVIPKT